MTEQEWLACTDPTSMLAFLQGKVSERKLRLFACACCRSLWHWLEDKRSRYAVESSERYADGLATRQDVASARKQMKPDYRGKRRASIAKSVSEEAAYRWAFGWDMARYTIRARSFDAATLEVLSFRSRLASEKSPAVLMHDIFGPLPFRPITLDSTLLAWNDRTIPKLAQGVYDERAFDRLPILADALEEAGCGNTDILNHCRSEGPHVRGCWPVDLILGKF